MPIKTQCECGKWLRMPDDAAGRRARCPACNRIFVVTASEPEPTPVVSLPSDELDFAEDREADLAAASARAAARRRAESAGADSDQQVKPLPSWIKPNTDPPPPATRRAVLEPVVGKTNRPYHYLFLLLALLPLAWSTFKPHDKEDVGARISQTLRDHPESREQAKAADTMEELCAAMPGDRIEGALLPYDTYVHWGFAAVSGAIFFGLVLLLFPPGHTKIWQLLIISVFTGTAGIILLLGFQWIAFHVPLVVPRGIVGLLIDIVALIGASYSLAMGNSGFLLSALGFTAGVGFCEETCKALPLIWKARTDGFYSWRSAMIWGLVSGVGFGVSEGITYSHDFYNGVLGGQIYLIRFISCVALHAIWTAATGINIFRRQDYFRGQLHVLEWLMQIAITIIVPMILHGMYDTLLKEEYDWAALLVAFASFGWLAWQIELAKRRFDGLPAGHVV